MALLLILGWTLALIARPHHQVDVTAVKAAAPTEGPSAASPPLPPEEALKTFALESGFRIQLVACEPMIEAPVAATFDEDGRLWVVEMRTYMPDLEARNELEPRNRIVVLEDDDGDGVMDRSSVFLDGLVLPRA